MRENIHITLNINCRIIDNLGQILGFLKKHFYLLMREKESKQQEQREEVEREHRCGTRPGSRIMTRTEDRCLTN